ncbi:unnamed protein product [Thlaspi arvense]|uniref:Uncharacterized protein n=1 Tax=Thlaspi arvense TaxID=13288 RepID=A0AAU9TA55_THLAR|nr:unnamed protein product [Thlaspi arvense]
MNGHWILPPARSENQVNLQAYLTTTVLTDDEDYYEWETDEKVSSKYRTGQVYAKLRPESDEVPWGKIVWNVGVIDSYAAFL